MSAYVARVAPSTDTCSQSSPASTSARNVSNDMLRTDRLTGGR
jgi:hypothetical protein